MVIGWGVFNKAYSMLQVLCVLVASGGAVLIVVAERMVHSNGPPALDGDCGQTGACGRQQPEAPAGNWAATAAAGELVLVLVLAIAAWLTHIQSSDRRLFPKATSGESMFWTHLLGLVLLLVLGADSTPSWLRGGEEGYVSKALRWGNSRPTSQFVTEIMQSSYWPVTEAAVRWALGSWISSVPHLFTLTLVNGLTQIVCVSGVYTMLGAGEPVSMTLVMTARKAITWGLSVVLFGHPTVWLHYIAAAVVFSGVAAYSFMPQAAATETRPEPGQKTAEPREDTAEDTPEPGQKTAEPGEQPASDGPRQRRRTRRSSNG
jgi:hypothetical protein